MKVSIIGGGLSGATLASLLAEQGHKVDVYEKRKSVGGNCSDKEIIISNNGTSTLKSDFGVHIFHTDKKYIWKYLNKFAEFHSHTLQVQAKTEKGILPLPINLNTVQALYGSLGTNVFDNTPIALDEYDSLESAFKSRLRYYATNDLFDLFIRDYSEKQWGRNVNEIPSSIANRIPTRNTYDNRYFTDEFQGVPTLGFSHLIKQMLDSDLINVYTDYNVELYELATMSEHYDKVIFCGAVDDLFGNKFGELEYRSLRWVDDLYETSNHQGCLVLNNCTTDEHTRTVEWKHLSKHFDNSDYTVVTKEYPMEYIKGKNEPLYPIGSQENKEKHKKYLKELSNLGKNILPLGRLAQYRYFDMDDAVEEAFNLFNKITKR